MTGEPFHEAVAAFRKINRTMELTGDDLDLWLVDGHVCTDGEVNAVVDVFMRDATVSLFRFASGHALEPAAAVKGPEMAWMGVR